MREKKFPNLAFNIKLHGWSPSSLSSLQFSQDQLRKQQKIFRRKCQTPFQQRHHYSDALSHLFESIPRRLRRQRERPAKYVWTALIPSMLFLLECKWCNKLRGRMNSMCAPMEKIFSLTLARSRLHLGWCKWSPRCICDDFWHQHMLNRRAIEANRSKRILSLFYVISKIYRLTS